jgi:hypothetical protein
MKERISVLVDQFVSPTLNTNLSNIILEAAEKRLTGIYHVAGETRISRYAFALKLAETFNPFCLYRLVPGLMPETTQPDRLRFSVHKPGIFVPHFGQAPVSVSWYL